MFTPLHIPTFYVGMLLATLRVALPSCHAERGTRGLNGYRRKGDSLANSPTDLGQKRPFSTTLRQNLTPKSFVFLFWLAVIGGYWGYARYNNLAIADIVEQISHWLTGGWYGPLLYMVLYALRPLLFFPATILTLLGGFIFGPIGILYTILGSNASAMVAYGVGRFFGKDLLNKGSNAGVVQQYTERMRQNGFETVLIMRLIFLPYDLVNYAAGFFRIRWQAFLTATVIGTVPGTISFVLFGASFGTLNDLLMGNIQVNPATLFLSILFVGISIVLSRFIKKREARQKQLPLSA